MLIRIRLKILFTKAKEDGSLVLYRRSEESTFDFVERYINAVNKLAKKGLANPIDEKSRCLWNNAFC